MYYKTTKSEYVFSVEICYSFKLSADVVYKFTYQCDTTLSYVGYTVAHHVVTRAREHLNFNSAAKYAIKDQVYSCLECIEKHFSVYDFDVLKNVILNTKQKFKKYW